MDEDLRRLGDVLERAVAGVIAAEATRAHDPGDDRNVGGRSRHLMITPPLSISARPRLTGNVPVWAGGRELVWSAMAPV